jgi:2-oxoglutarate ferredoxin oxidoreductase subunit alpha
MTETPCVFVNVQRGGPSTGLPTLPAQADMMQARWGSHGDYEIIALSPSSPQECFDFTIHAFNLSEEYRVPVLVMMDEVVGHMTEKVIIPSPDKIKIYPRRLSKKPPEEFKLYETNGGMIPEMVHAGMGYRFHVTGLTHDDRGYPAMNVEAQDKLVRRLIDKITKNVDRISMIEEENMEDADIVVMSYGITARVAERAITMARAKGLKVGKMRLITVWPFPEKKIAALAKRVKAFVVPELNMGQVVLEVERAAAGNAHTILVPHAGGSVHRPEQILAAIEEAAK